MDGQNTGSAQKAKDRTVFKGSVIIITIFVLVCVIFSALFEGFFGALQQTVSSNTGWFLIFSMNAILIFCFYMAFSRFSHIRLGGPDASPDYSISAWLSMLFAAGMGIGLIFYSVAEPVQHYSSFLPHVGERKAAAAALSMDMTFLHWGFHPWAVYSLVGLCLAFYHFNKGLALTFSSGFDAYGEGGTLGWKGHLINIVAVVATAFGVATSLGLGVDQANAGLEHLFGVPHGLQAQLLLLIIVTIVSLVAIARGMDKGIKLLSQFTLVGALVLMIFILLVGPTVFILKALGENIGKYLSDLLRLASWNDTYTGSNWQDKWTVFYWGWWISWSPFVGLFIARISRGRTVREFMLGVMLVPSAFNFIWMTVFGGTALNIEIFGDGGLSQAVESNVSLSLFDFLGRFPLSLVSSSLTVLIVLLFFVTSANSGAVVVATITSNGLDPTVKSQAFWVFAISILAAALMFGGGLVALQAATITTGLPFAIILLAMAYGLLKTLKKDYGPPKVKDALI
jgi:choline/glycine/proline betaine transport protein